jgi:ribokinase
VARVVVVGSINVDLVVVTERLPAAGETVTGGRFASHGGGKSANQAVAAARLGADVVFVGAVGRDAMGDEAEAALRAEGVDVSRLARG